MENFKYIKDPNTGKEYPVIFLHKDRNWVWKQKNWIGDLSKIASHHFKKAEDLSQKIDELNKLAGYEYFQQLLIDLYAKELEASWRIEGEYLDSFALRSALVKELCLNVSEWNPNRELIRDVRENATVTAALEFLNSKKTISIKEICNIHGLLGSGDNNKVKENFGELRKEGEVVGRIRNNNYEVIYEAPHPDDVPKLMDEYLNWWNKSKEILPTPLGAILAHLYFVEIHPFQDGNGRMARLLADKYFVRNQFESLRSFSMTPIRTHKTDTLETLKTYSAKTGASYPTIENLILNDQQFANIYRESLLPYICISQYILGQKSAYYITLDRYSSTSNIDQYLRYMFSLLENSLEGTLKRVPLIYNLCDFFKKFENVFSPEDRLVIRNCYLGDISTLILDFAIADIDDEILGERIWRELTEAGLIDNYGKAILDPNLVENLQKIRNKKFKD